MDEDTFEAVVIEALDSLPPEFARYMQNVEVQIEPRPNREHRRAVGLKPWQTLYGLYQGVPLTERAGGSPFLPDLITIFQEPLERDFPGRDALRARYAAQCYTRSRISLGSAMRDCANLTPTN